MHISAPNFSDQAGPSSKPYTTMPAQVHDYTSAPVTFDPSSNSGAGSHSFIDTNQRPNPNLDPGWTGQRPSVMSQVSSNSQQERPGNQSRRSTLPHPPSSSRTNSDPYPLMVLEHPTFLGLAQPAPKMEDQGVYHYFSDLCLGAILCQCFPCMRYKPEDQYKAQKGGDSRSGWG